MNHYPIVVRIGGCEHAWTVAEARAVRDRIDLALSAHVACWACANGVPPVEIDGVTYHGSGPVYDVCGNHAEESSPRPLCEGCTKQWAYYYDGGGDYHVAPGGKR